MNTLCLWLWLKHSIVWSNINILSAVAASYCRFQPTLHPGAFCARVWFWGVTWGIRSSVNSACISVVFPEIESYLKPLSCDTKNVHSGAILRNSVFGVLSLCTRNISLNSHRIVPIRPVLRSPFRSVSNDIWYVVFRATFDDRFSPITPTVTYHFAITISRSVLIVSFQFDLFWKAIFIPFRTI